MFDILQAIVIMVGAIFLIKGIVNIFKGYNIGNLLSILIKLKSKKTIEKRGNEL